MLSFDYKWVQTGHGKLFENNTIYFLEMTVDSDLNFKKLLLEMCKNTIEKISTLSMQEKIPLEKREKSPLKSLSSRSLNIVSSRECFIVDK